MEDGFGGYRDLVGPYSTPAVPGVHRTPGTPRPAGDLVCMQHAAGRRRAESGLSRQGFGKSSPPSSAAPVHAGAWTSGGMQDPVWMPVARHPDSQPRGVPLVG